MGDKVGGPEDIAPGLWFAIDILGTFVFGLSGGPLATRKRFDIVGIAVLAVAAGAELVAAIGLRLQAIRSQ